MSVIKIYEENNLIFVIPHFNENKCLSELRKQLEKDGFQRPSDYRFNFHGVEISKYQENLVILENVTTAEVSSGGRKILNLQITSSETTPAKIKSFNESATVIDGSVPNETNVDRSIFGSVHKEYHNQDGLPDWNLTMPKQINDHWDSDTKLNVAVVTPDKCLKKIEPTNSGEVLEEQGSEYLSISPVHVDAELQPESLDQDVVDIKLEKTQKTVSSFLRSPKPWEAKGIKIYSPNEIDLAKGYEKRRREFWNKEAKKLSHSTNLSREQIVKCVNERWRKEKATVMENEFEEKRTSWESCTTPNVKSKTLCKNIERIKSIKKNISDLEEEISRMEKEVKRGDESLHLLKQQKSCVISQMKKAQDSMRKNLNKFELPR